MSMEKWACRSCGQTLKRYIGSNSCITDDLDVRGTSKVADTVNNRPIAARSYTEDDFHAITPNDLILQRSRNLVPGANYCTEENLTKRQQVMKELEDAWWSQWLVQAFPHMIPYKRWKHEKRSLRPGDIVQVLYDKKVGKGIYRLGRIIDVHPDSHGIVHTVTVGMKRLDKREVSLPYLPRGSFYGYTVGVSNRQGGLSWSYDGETVD